MSSYDRFADSRLGGAFTRYMLHDIDKKPSLFQRAAINTAMGTAYLADMSLRASAAYGSAPTPPTREREWNIRSRTKSTRSLKRYSGKVRGHRVSGSMTDLGQRHQQHVRGVGKLYGKHKRTPRAIIYNKRIHQNEPVTVVHEVKQELRSEPGSQAVVTMIGERLLPNPDFSGRLLTDVNKTNEAGSTGQNFFLYDEFTGAGSVAPASGVVLNHRRDWTMGTNASWRDGYAFANGQLNATSAMESGYGTPYIEGGNGVPAKWYESPSVLIDPTGGSREAVVEEEPDAPAASSAMAVLLRNYYHLYEEISWKIMNNSGTGTNVTIYECILNRDIPIQQTFGFSGQATVVNWGGMPCPLELWRQSQQLATASAAGLTTDGDVYYTSLPTNPIAAGENEGPGVASSRLQKDPTAAGAARGLAAKDIDYPNARPNKAALLHTYYKVIPHTRYLPAGADTTITIGVRYNKRIPGAWWNTLYGVSGMTRSFFMVSRPDEVVGVTGADGSTLTSIDGKNRLPVMNATDLMVSWTKKKTVARTKQRTRHVWVYKAAIPSALDVAFRNPITLKVHDADVFMGEEADRGNTGEDA